MSILTERLTGKQDERQKHLQDNKNPQSYAPKISLTHQRLKIHSKAERLHKRSRTRSESTRKVTPPRPNVQNQLGSVQKGRNHRKNGRTQADGAGARLPSQPWPPASAERLTSEKSGIVTSSRSRGRLLAALLRKLATEPQLSCSGHQGEKHNRRGSPNTSGQANTSRKAQLRSHSSNIYKPSLVKSEFK